MQLRLGSIGSYLACVQSEWNIWKNHKHLRNCLESNELTDIGWGKDWCCEVSQSINQSLTKKTLLLNNALARKSKRRSKQNVPFCAVHNESYPRQLLGRRVCCDHVESNIIILSNCMIWLRAVDWPAAETAPQCQVLKVTPRQARICGRSNYDASCICQFVYICAWHSYIHHSSPFNYCLVIFAITRGTLPGQRHRQHWLVNGLRLSETSGIIPAVFFLF